MPGRSSTPPGSRDARGFSGAGGGQGRWSSERIQSLPAAPPHASLQVAERLEPLAFAITQGNVTAFFL